MPFPGGEVVKNLPTNVGDKMWYWSLDWKNPLEKEMEPHSSILAWEIPWTRGAWQATVHGVTKSQTQLSTCTHYYRSFINVFLLLLPHFLFLSFYLCCLLTLSLCILSSIHIHCVLLHARLRIKLFAIFQRTTECVLETENKWTHGWTRNE